MEETYYKDPVQLSKGINMRELIGGQSEFHIDLDFKKKSMGMMVGCDDDLFPDMDDDSDSEDPLDTIEKDVENLMLSSPEYLSFKDLATKMVDCIPSGEVKMLIMEEGDGPLVPVDAMVTVHYAAYYEKSKIPFDSTLTMNNQSPLQMHLGRGRFIPGLEIGLTSVKGPQARFNLLLEASMAWGKQGVYPRIRPHEPVLFVIMMYQVHDTQAGKRFNDLPSEEQKKFEVTVRTVTSLHSQAKFRVSKKKYALAIKDYQQSISILNISTPNNKDEENEIKKLKVNSCVNLCVCYYKINKPKYILNMCENLDYIIDIEKHCKALFYKGRAYELLGKNDEAVKFYKKAKHLEPKNKEIGLALANIHKYNIKSAEKEKEIWQNAFKSPEEKVNKKVVYDVDEDFQNGVLEMCQSLAERDEYSKFDLPNTLSEDEVGYIKDLCSKFEGLVVLQEAEGRKKKISIIKT